MIRYYVCVGRECPHDSMMRLARGGIEARDYYIESVPWILLCALYDQRLLEGSPTHGRVVEVDHDIGKFFWDTFGPDDYEDASG